MEEFHADLHCHTFFSDGTFSPRQLLQLAKQNGLQGLSITDHDSVAAYPSALPIAEEMGIALVPGVEFSAVLSNVSVHILGYSFAINNQLIAAFCQRHKLRRQLRNQSIMALLAKQGMPVTQDDIEELMKDLPSESARTIGRPHIAQIMVLKGYTTSIAEAFRSFLGEGRSCYVPGAAFSVEETLDILHQANAFAVIAHPHLIKENTVLQKLLKMNFDGIECYYAMFNAQQNERWLSIAQKKEWLITGGSDFHGAIKPMIPLGASWIGADSFQRLQERFLSNIG